MTLPCGRALALLGGAGLAAVTAVKLPAGPAAQQRPQFRTSTDVVQIDTRVVTRDGKPIEGLKPEQFEVSIDGKRRPILAAEFLRSSQGPAPTGDAPSPAAGSLPPTAGRVFVLGIDEGSFPLSARASAIEAGRRVIDGLNPEDSLGLVAFPNSVAVAPTRDRAAVRAALERITGRRVDLSSRYNISATEAGIIRTRDSQASREIILRECPAGSSITCLNAVKADAAIITDMLEQQGLTSISGIHSVLDAMEVVPGQKTLIVISAGIPMSTEVGARPNINLETARLAAHAASLDVNLYVFFMNVHFLRHFSPETGKRNNTLFADITMFGYGLEKLADGAGGTFFQIQVDADPYVDRVLRETSAYYLLFVASEPRDRDGKEHFIRVSVKQRGATVRHRQVVTIPKGP